MATSSDFPLDEKGPSVPNLHSVRLFLPGLAGVVGLCGCASVHVSGYYAFGDSITYGGYLPDRESQAYPFLVAKAENLLVTNYAISGDEACDIPARQIFPNSQNPFLASATVSSILIGTNDANNHGAGAYEPVFKECHLSAVSWQAVPAQDKVLVGSEGFETSGPGVSGSFGTSPIWTTQGAGAGMSFAIELKQPGAIYAWPVIDDTSDAAYSYSIDGAPAGTANVRTNPVMATTNGTRRSVGFLRFGGVGAGRHVITFTQTSSGNDGVSVLGIGAISGTAKGKLPVVLVGTVPYQLYPGQSCCCMPANDQPCLSYIQDIQNDVSLLAADGLDVRLFDTRKFMLATSAEMSNSVHPNALGDQKLADAVESVWPAN